MTQVSPLDTKSVSDKATQPMQQSMRGYVMRKLALELEWLEGLLAETDAQLESESNGAHDE